MIQLIKPRNFGEQAAQQIVSREVRAWASTSISAGSLIEGLHCSHCLSFRKLICLCSSGEERIRTEKHPKKFDLKEMKLSVYISGAHSECSKIEKNIFRLVQTFAFLSERTKGTRWRECSTTVDFARNKLTYHKDLVNKSRKMPHHISAPHLPPVRLR